jgi:hypothetical protein
LASLKVGSGLKLIGSLATDLVKIAQLFITRTAKAR